MRLLESLIGKKVTVVYAQKAGAERHLTFTGTVASVENNLVLLTNVTSDNMMGFRYPDQIVNMLSHEVVRLHVE